MGGGNRRSVFSSSLPSSSSELRGFNLIPHPSMEGRGSLPAGWGQIDVGRAKVVVVGWVRTTKYQR